MASPLLLTYVFFSTTNTTMVSDLLLINLPKNNKPTENAMLYKRYNHQVYCCYHTYYVIIHCYTYVFKHWFVLYSEFCNDSAILYSRLGYYWTHWKRVVFLQATIDFVMKMFYFKKNIGILHGADYNTKER